MKTGHFEKLRLFLSCFFRNVIQIVFISYFLLVNVGRMTCSVCFATLVQVYAVTDERLGEQVACSLRVKPGTSITLSQVKTFCKGKVNLIPFSVHFYSVSSRIDVLFADTFTFESFDQYPLSLAWTCMFPYYERSL